MSRKDRDLHARCLERCCWGRHSCSSSWGRLAENREGLAKFQEKRLNRYFKELKNLILENWVGRQLKVSLLEREFHLSLGQIRSQELFHKRQELFLISQKSILKFKVIWGVSQDSQEMMVKVNTELLFLNLSSLIKEIKQRIKVLSKED